MRIHLFFSLFFRTTNASKAQAILLSHHTQRHLDYDEGA
jgi:hypothetical protein